MVASTPVWTLEKIAALSLADRHELWKKTRGRTEEAYVAVREMIEASGLPYSDTAALTMDDPITIKMWEIINSPEGRAACEKATAQGLPAMAGVDGMLNAALGVDYGGQNMATQTAGGLVGELMRTLGYEKVAQRKMPPGCVAKSAVVWTKRKPGAKRKS